MSALGKRKSKEGLIAVLKYPAVVRELDQADGGGYFVEVLDLAGCIADGETPEEALANAAEAVEEWIDAARELGRPIPEPDSIEDYSGKWVQRVPKSLHMKLVEQAKREGVSLNALATALIAEGLGQRNVADSS